MTISVPERPSLFGVLLSYAIGLIILRGVVRLAIIYYKARRTNNLLRIYNDEVESLGVDIDVRLAQELVTEISLIEDLEKEHKNYDDILRRRIYRCRASTSKSPRPT